MSEIHADTAKIGAWSILALLLLGPIIAPVYAAYSVGIQVREKGGWLKYPYSFAFAFMNTAHNWLVCSILFREFPREFFTTTRLKRWKKSNDDQRRELADMLGGFLNRHDIDHY